MKKNRRWWESKWYWIFFILLLLVLDPAIHLFFFPEVSLSDAIASAVVTVLGIVVCILLARKFAKILKVKPDTSRRIIIIVGSAFIMGPFLWGLIVYIPASYFGIDHPIVFLSMFVVMAVCGIIADIVMRRRGYRPFMEGRGNI